MKTLRLIIFAACASFTFITSCQRNAHDELATFKSDQESATAAQTSASLRGPSGGICNPNAYVITLESRTLINGYWEWIWSILNPNPGNGNNGTAQDLSNWGMQLGSCVNWTSVISAAYSSNGSTWNSFTPTYQVNPSQGCLTTSVLKFDFGTTGTAKTYYRLIINQDVAEGTVQGYYKSGNNTSCCTFNFTGLACGGPIELVE